MRIDFGAQYKEVSRLLRASAHEPARGSESSFERNLNSLLPESGAKTATSSARVPPSQANQSSLEEVKASYRFAGPELSLPDIKATTPQVAPAVEPSPNSESVKTPTLLEAKRIEFSEPRGGVQAPQLTKEQIRERLAQAGQKFGIEPRLAMSVVKTESAFNPLAVSTDGHASKGLFQLLDSTGKTLLSRAGSPERNYDPFDPDLNIELGASYLKYLQEIFQTKTVLPNDHSTRPAADKASLEKLAVAAFNAGEGRVASAQNRAERAGRDPSQYEHVAPYLPDSTRTYVSRVISGKSLF
jgi:soluble lytic murein transglycosylase-like protein